MTGSYRTAGTNGGLTDYLAAGYYRRPNWGFCNVEPSGYAYEGSSSTSAFYDPSTGAEETMSRRVTTLTREIEEMRRV
ncbi:hypothetical protein MA16_Dca016022 [Dendrobium catenatum]|uniref:Uncharacterized protein n=1 Tax=Dendrobium catenatum TaxID=906689 RepID=A0A2I0VJR5_9ASPA|nr:hypothetical protein MA16_Dca016022 [Dendrobium catenatum]